VLQLPEVQLTSQRAAAVQSVLQLPWQPTVQCEGVCSSALPQVVWHPPPQVTPHSAPDEQPMAQFDEQFCVQVPSVQVPEQLCAAQSRVQSEPASHLGLQVGAVTVAQEKSQVSVA